MCGWDSLYESSVIAEGMSSWAPTKYKTKNWSSYNDSLKQRGSLSIWFDPEMVWTPPPNGKRGRQQQFSDAGIQTCLTLKGEGRLGNMPLACFSPEREEPRACLGWSPLRAPLVRATMATRQTTGFIQSLLRLVGLDLSAPDFSTLCRRQKTLNVSLPYHGGAGQLTLLIDSTGIKAEGEGAWNARKHGGSKRRIWRKRHIGIDEGKEDQERPQWGVPPTSWKCGQSKVHWRMPLVRKSQWTAVTSVMLPCCPNS